jgi:DNA-directed RNA polymerase specialized sigma24 family protein
MTVAKISTIGGGVIESGHSPHMNAEEVEELIRQLKPTELKGIFLAGEAFIIGTNYQSVRELYSDAVAKAYLGERRCPIDVKFSTFLINVMRSIASNYKTSKQSSIEVSECRINSDHSPLDSASSSIFSQPNSESEEERASREKQEDSVIAAVYAKFAADPEVTAILLGESENSSPQEIMDLASMDQRSYETARRRYRRGVTNLIASGEIKHA